MFPQLMIIRQLQFCWNGLIGEDVEIALLKHGRCKVGYNRECLDMEVP